MPILVSLVVGLAAAATQRWMLLELGIPWGAETPFVWASVALPAVASAIAGAAASAMRPAARASAPEASATPEPAPEPPEHAALRLLGRLQEEGRLVDFLTEDVQGYSDEQIGAATRGIHEACAKALREALTLERILPGAEDEQVTVEPGFDPSAIRLIGNVGGAPPFHGVLRHAGWRATRVAVPARPGVDPAVLAPAEVEIA